MVFSSTDKIKTFTKKRPWHVNNHQRFFKGNQPYVFMYLHIQITYQYHKHNVSPVTASDPPFGMRQ